jgi:hypothetical protein
MSVSTSPVNAPPRPRRLGWTLALLAFAQFIIAVDYNIVDVAPPDIGRGLNFSGQPLQWVVSAYAVRPRPHHGVLPGRRRAPPRRSDHRRGPRRSET